MKEIFSWAIEIAVLCAVYYFFELPGLIIGGVDTVGIESAARWKVSHQVNLALLEAKSSAAAWTLNEDDVDRSLEFKTMILTCDAHPRLDGYALYAMDQES